MAPKRMPVNNPADDQLQVHQQNMVQPFGNEQEYESSYASAASIPRPAVDERHRDKNDFTENESDQCAGKLARSQ